MFRGARWFAILVIVSVMNLSSQAQTQPTNQPTAQSTNLDTTGARWLEKAGPVPQFKVPSSRWMWQLKRKRVRKELNELLGKLPPRPKVPEVKTLLRQEIEDFIVEKFQFDNGAGAIVPGYLLLPKNHTGKLPAIVYCHWHGGQYDVGKEELFHASHTPFAPGPVFVQHGFAVIAIDAYCFGQRNGQGPGGPAEKGSAGEMTAAKFNLWVGRTLWGMILRDDLMALDYLVSRPEIDTNRIGVTGMSMGATRSWWLMALDDRIKTGVAVDCLTRYQNLIQQEQLAGHGIYYFVPGMLNHFDTEAVVSLIAPRPILFMNGADDPTSPVDGIHAIASVVRPIYGLYGKTNDFQTIIYPDVAHVYTPEMWQKTVAWFDQRLGH